MRRLHSLTGFVFAFAFVFLFLLPYSTAIYGYESFNLLSDIAARIPLLGEFEAVFILVPLALHAVIGLSVIHSSQFNVIAYGTYRNWMYALQRMAGLILIPFIIYHVYFTRIVFAFTGRHADFAYMHNLLSSEWVSALYVAGIVAAAFYIGNGASIELVRWGVAVKRRSQDVIAMIMWVVTLIMALWGIRILMSF